MAYVVAVDPGLTGAVAVFFECGDPIEVFDMPVREVGEGFVKREVDAQQLAERIGAYIDGACVTSRAVMERVTAMPGQGVSSMLSLGDSRGSVRGVVITMGLKFMEVLPQRWKKEIGLIPSVTVRGPKMTSAEKQQRKIKAKADSVAMAQRLFPAFANLLTRAKDHGRAEALLIGHWATRNGV